MIYVLNKSRPINLFNPPVDPTNILLDLYRNSVQVKHVCAEFLRWSIDSSIFDRSQFETEGWQYHCENKQGKSQAPLHYGQGRDGRIHCLICKKKLTTVAFSRHLVRHFKEPAAHKCSLCGSTTQGSVELKDIDSWVEHVHSVHQGCNGVVVLSTEAQWPTSRPVELNFMPHVKKALDAGPSGKKKY